MKPQEFLRKLAAIVPPPHRNLTRYHGVFAAHHHLRQAVVPAARDVAVEASAPLEAVPLDSGSRPPKSWQRRLCWAELLKRVYAIDVLQCDPCGGHMRMLAVICESAATVAILDCLGLHAGYTSAWRGGQANVKATG